MKINEAFCDKQDRPYQDIRITHTIILDDPLDDPPGIFYLLPSIDCRFAAGLWGQYMDFFINIKGVILFIGF